MQFVYTKTDQICVRYNISKYHKTWALSGVLTLLKPVPVKQYQTIDNYDTILISCTLTWSCPFFIVGWVLCIGNILISTRGNIIQVQVQTCLYKQNTLLSALWSLNIFLHFHSFASQWKKKKKRYKCLYKVQNAGLSSRKKKKKKTIPRGECNRVKFYLLRYSIALRTLLLSPLEMKPCKCMIMLIGWSAALTAQCH